MRKVMIILILVLVSVSLVNAFLSWGPVLTMFIPMIAAKLLIKD
jgi:hypothetical protein